MKSQNQNINSELEIRDLSNSELENISGGYQLATGLLIGSEPKYDAEEYQAMYEAILAARKQSQRDVLVIDNLFKLV